MTSSTPSKRMKEKWYVGVDVGGTKIQASLISEAGTIRANHRVPSPRDCTVEVTLDTIESAIRVLLEAQETELRQIAAIGIAVPGVVQPETGFVVVTPNMNLTGVELGQIMKERLQVPIAIGNDCNLGTLGECWLGSGRNASSCVGIFVGTGIGAGIVMDGRIVGGAGQAAGEIGHIVSQIPCEDWRSALQSSKLQSPKRKKGERAALTSLSTHSSSTLPRCGCGNYGCFETFASRSAMERDIREAIAGGAKSAIVELNGGTLNVIKSGAIAKALKANDPVVVAIVRYASQVIGNACLTVRHLLDPEVIVIGGGVLEACQKFMMPVIEAVVSNDQLASAGGTRRILISSLGDDAVVLGAVALARHLGGVNPLKRTKRVTPKYPTLHLMAENVIHIADVPYQDDFYILPDASLQARPHQPKKNPDGFRLKDIQAAAKGGVDLMILATPAAGEVSLSGKCHDFLFRRGIDYRILPLDEAVQLYNSVAVRRAAVFHF